MMMESQMAIARVRDDILSVKRTEAKEIEHYVTVNWHAQSPRETITNGLPVVTFLGGARDIAVIVEGNGHRDPSSNPGRRCLHFI